MARPIDPRQRRMHRVLYAGIALAIMGGIAFMVSQEAQTLGGTISLDAMAKNLGQDPYNIVVLDTRPAGVWESGHVPFSIPMPLEQLGRRMGELASVKDRQIAVIDDDAEREKKAAQFLAQSGFRSVVTAPEGMSGWRAQGKKLETAKDSPIHPIVQ